MKRKKVNVIISVVVIVVVGVTVFLIGQWRALVHDPHAHLHDSKPHPHVTSDGNVVSHIHTYNIPVEDKQDAASNKEVPTTTSSGTAVQQQKEKYKVQAAWERIVDVAAVKRDWQPYTIAEMHELWWHDELGIHWQKYQGWIEDIYPHDEWLQRCMDLGHPLLAGYNYRSALGIRRSLHSEREDFNNLDPYDFKTPDYTVRDSLLSELGIPAGSNITWEAYEDLFIKSKVIAQYIFEREYRTDPNYIGGTVSAIGVFTPFQKDTAYVHVDLDTRYVGVTGARLTPEEREDLMVYGIAPKGMHIIYRDKDGNPLPSDAPKPRFYEQRMKALEQAEKHIEKLIADHEALFKSVSTETTSDPLDPNSKTNTPLPEKEHTHPHPEGRQDSPAAKQRPLQPGPNRAPLPGELPPEPPGAQNVEQWFEILLELHGGDLPKDVKALQKIIKELDLMRQKGEEYQKQRLPGARSKPSAPPVPSAEEKQE